MWMYIKSEKKKKKHKKKIEKLLMGCVLLIFVYVHSQRHLLSPSHFSLRFVCIYIALFFFCNISLEFLKGMKKKLRECKKEILRLLPLAHLIFLAKFILYIYGIEKKKPCRFFFFFLQFPNPPRLSARRLLRACHYCKRKMETKKKKTAQVRWLQR